MDTELLSILNSSIQDLGIRTVDKAIPLTRLRSIASIISQTQLTKAATRHTTPDNKRTIFIMEKVTVQRKDNHIHNKET